MASSSDDYSPGPYGVTFHSNQIEALFNISITSNNLLERDKIFLLTIGSSSLPDAVSTGHLGAATVLIQDDDRE